MRRTPERPGRLIQPKFYHQTTSERWAEIQKEGVLWGSPSFWRGEGRTGYRYTYLAPDLFYGDDPQFDVILEVTYTPVGAEGPKGPGIDNYGFHPPEGQYCTQFSVFVPIPLSQVRVVSRSEVPPREELIEASKRLRPPGPPPDPAWGRTPGGVP